MTPADVARFSKRIKKLPSGCWKWTGETQSQKTFPYGLFRYRNQEGKRAAILAHKLSWLIAHPEFSEVPEGFELGHSCHFQLCCNPDHVSPIPHPANVFQSWNEGRRLCRHYWHKLRPDQKSVQCPDCGEKRRRAA